MLVLSEWLIIVSVHFSVLAIMACCNWDLWCY